MPNRLEAENSPYLLQHANNPVDWYPWGDLALEKAKAEDKPVFLSIGYAACHWCHVMAHESFEDPEVAGFLNKYFVNIKVDREERPDLDSIYMNAVVAMTGHGGWPMSVFLTPEGIPFYGGTYFPPTRRYNMPSFSEVIQTIARLWNQDREKLIKSGEEITQHLKTSQSQALNAENETDRGVLDQAVLRLAQSFDWKYGGWGQAPKFPQAMALEFLLRRASQSDQLSLDMVNHALVAYSKGGMYDVLGGGFSRYSTDNQYLVPHFEKMLYDNALLSRVYLYAYLVTKDSYFLGICRSTLDFIARELRHPEGGFYSSLDADSEGEEGKFYLWTYEELSSELQAAQAATPGEKETNWMEFFSSAFNVTKSGNFEGKIILQRALNDGELSEKFSLPLEEVRELIARITHHLFEVRQQRIRPGTDDKVLVAWNALALHAFAEAARYLNDDHYLTIAQQNASFLLENLMQDGRLFRSWRNGKAQHQAYLEDYASLVLALLALYQTDHNQDWFTSATVLVDVITSLFIDPDGGFFETAADHEALLVRPKEIQDNATPSGNSLAAMALLQSAAFGYNRDWNEYSLKMLSSISNLAIRYPTAFSYWLCAYDFSLADRKEIAILYPESHPDLNAFLEIIWADYQPNITLGVSKYPIKPEAPELLSDRHLKNHQTTVFVCQNFVCQQPVNTPGEMEKLLKDSR